MDKLRQAIANAEFQREHSSSRDPFVLDDAIIDLARAAADDIDELRREVSNALDALRERVTAIKDTADFRNTRF